MIKEFDEFVRLRKEFEAMNEKKVRVKRQYTDKHPAKTVNSNAVIRNSVLMHVASNDGKISESDMKEFITMLGEDRGKQVSSSWLSSNKKYLKRVKESAGVFYKLTSAGRQLIEKLELTEDNDSVYSTSDNVSGMGDVEYPDGDSYGSGDTFEPLDFDDEEDEYYDEYFDDDGYLEEGCKTKRKKRGVNEGRKLNEEFIYVNDIEDEIPVIYVGSHSSYSSSNQESFDKIYKLFVENKHNPLYKEFQEEILMLDDTDGIISIISYDVDYIVPKRTLRNFIDYVNTHIGFSNDTNMYIGDNHIIKMNYNLDKFNKIYVD